MAVALLLSGPAAAQSDPLLSPVQVALFEAPHFALIQAPMRLDYAFRREEAGRPTVEDRITLDIRAGHPDGGHDVHAEFLTGERRIAYPPALGFRSNPLLLFALDRDTRELAAATGGSVAWFRTRLRRGFVDQAAMREAAPDAAGNPTVEIDLAPYQGEPRAGRFQDRRYVFVLTKAVPGGVAEIRTTLPAAGGRGAVLETIAFAGTRRE